MRNINERPEDPFASRAEFQDESLDPLRSEVVSLDAHRNKAGAGKLLPQHEIDALRARWTAIQSSFVDEPQQSVKDADDLVSSAISQIADGFREQRAQLETQWSAGNDASTEDLRLSLQRYRTFFDRLLSI